MDRLVQKFNQLVESYGKDDRPIVLLTPAKEMVDKIPREAFCDPEIKKMYYELI